MITIISNVVRPIKITSYPGYDVIISPFVDYSETKSNAHVTITDEFVRGYKYQGFGIKIFVTLT